MSQGNEEFSFSVKAMMIDEEEEEKYEEEGEGYEQPGISSVSFACEDCDYRWDMTVEVGNNENNLEDDQEYCPMCGSFNTLQI